LFTLLSVSNNNELTPPILH